MVPYRDFSKIIDYPEIVWVELFCEKIFLTLNFSEGTLRIHVSYICLRRNVIPI